MYTLGINAAFHDPSACLVRDGQVLAAAEDERFTHVKHGKRPVPFTTYFLPHHAIDYCLKEAGIKLDQVEHVAYSFNPYLLLGETQNQESIQLPLEPGAHRQADERSSPWDGLFLSSIVNAPAQLVDGVPFHLKSRFQNARVNSHFSFQWHFVEHHLSQIGRASCRERV